MEIVLIQDVPNLGRVGDIVEVKNGYARNYLIPKNFAVLATPGAKKQAEQIRNTAEQRRSRDLQTAEAFAAALRPLRLRFERRVGERGRLYGSVTSADVAERIEAELQTELDKRKVDLNEPIKELGDFEVTIHVHPDVTATVQVEVVGENGETAADFAEELPEGEPEAVAAQSEGDYTETQPDVDY